MSKKQDNKVKHLLYWIAFGLILVVIFVGGSYDGKRSDVYLTDYEITNNGANMVLTIALENEKSYVRKLTSQAMGDDKVLFTFYSTSGFRNPNGARESYSVILDENWNEIYFYAGGKNYSLELRKNEDGEWEIKDENNYWVVKEDIVEDITEDITEDTFEDYNDDYDDNIIEDTFDNLVEYTIEDTFEDTFEDIVEDTVD